MNAQNETRSRFSPACARACRQCAQAARHARAESCEWRGDESTRDVHRLHTARLARPRALRRLRARATRPPRAGNRARRRRPGCIVAAKPFGCVSVSPICTHVVCRRGWTACTYSCSGRARALPPATGVSASAERSERTGGAAPSGGEAGSAERHGVRNAREDLRRGCVALVAPARLACDERVSLARGVPAAARCGRPVVA